MRTKAGSIRFHYQDVSFHFRQRNELKNFILGVFRLEGPRVDRVDYIFCTDSYLLSLNRQFLQHDTLTDIITFPLSKRDDPLQAEIYISIDRVRENAFTLESGFQNELHRVIFHGALHLCGYRDKTKADQAKMRRKENQYLEKWFHVER